MSALLHLSIYPVGDGVSLSEPVSRVLRVIDQSGLRYELGAMGTTVEGEWDDLLRLLDACYKTLADHERVEVYAKFDVRRSGGANRLQGKVESIRKKLKGGG